MKSSFRRALLLHCLAREPWLTTRQLSIVCDEPNLKLLSLYLHELIETSWVQRANLGEPELPSEYVYALTNAGLRELARVEGRTCFDVSEHYGLTETTMLNMFNRLPFVFDLREYLLCPLMTSQRQYAHVHLRVWSWRRQLKQQFKFRGWYGTRQQQVQPDAYGVLVSRERAFPFFVLWDYRGASPPEAERRRLALFYQARDSGQLPFDWLYFPALVIIAATARRATEYRVLLQAIGERRGASAILPSFVVERERLIAAGPLAPIWTQAGHGAQRVGFLQGAPCMSEADYLHVFGCAQWTETAWASRLRFDTANPPAQSVLGVELSRLQRSASRPAQRVALANLRLKPHEKAVLTWMAGQGAVLPSHLRRYFAREGETVRSWLARLKRYKLIVELQPPSEITAQPLYVLSDDGLRFMALKENQATRRYRRRYGVRVAANELAPKDETQPVYTWRLLRHQLLIAERMLAFAEAARVETRGRRSKQSLNVWEGELRSAIEWRSAGQAHRLRPDAYGVYRIGDERIGFWLEVDRTHYKLRTHSQSGYTFARKARAYLSYFKHVWLLGLHVGFPTLLILTSTPSRMNSVRHIFVESAYELVMRLIPPVYVTTARLFERFGPLKPIWRTPLRKARVHCFEALADLPSSAHFSPSVTPAEFDAYVNPMLQAFLEAERHA